VQFVMKGLNVIYGSHYDHYYINYDLYSDDKPDPGVFQLGDLKCQAFPGPGMEHLYTFNPMREYMRNNTEVTDYAFGQYVKTHSKKYEEKEHVLRKELFKRNYRYIQSKNRASLGYTLSVNHLADRSTEELSYLRGRRHSGVYNGGSPFTYDRGFHVPHSFDWRLYGAVSPVKDQSVCGSCWSFGTTGTIEGAYFLKYEKRVSLSEQALVDCSWGFGNNGCDGGEDFRAYGWILKHGLPTEEDYGPYYGQDGFCHSANVTATAKIAGWVNVTPDDENALKIALLQHGPISVGIDAGHRSFAFYNDGVYYEPDCGNKPDQLDHAVLLVGYGKLKGQTYWLVKNSWSTYWGDDGYVLMSPRNNNCGVMTCPTFVTF